MHKKRTAAIRGSPVQKLAQAAALASYDSAISDHTGHVTAGAT